MDFNKLNISDACEKGAFLQLRHPITKALLFDDDKVEIGLELRGRDSETFRRVQREQTVRAMNEANKVGKTIQELARDLERNDEEEIELLVACTISIKGSIQLDDETVTVNNVAKLYRRSIEVKEQVRSFMRDRANFLKS